LVLAVIIAQWASTLTGSNSNTVRVSGVYLIIAYDGTSRDYFLGGSNQAPPGTSLVVAGGTRFTETFTLYTGSFTGLHQIRVIEWRSPIGFTLLAIEPNLPYTLAPNSTVRISLAIQAPASNFGGPLDFIVTVD
jgi:hypothetical protein